MENTAMQYLKEKLTPDLVPSPYDEWAEIFGAQNLFDFVQRYGGATLYIPKPENIIRGVRDNLIRQEYMEGLSYQELAVKYKLTEAWVRKICSYREEKSI